MRLQKCLDSCGPKFDVIWVPSQVYVTELLIWKKKTGKISPNSRRNAHLECYSHPLKSGFHITYTISGLLCLLFTDFYDQMENSLYFVFLALYVSL